MSLDFLSQTDEFRRLLRDIEGGAKGLRIAGLIEPAKPYFLTLLARKVKKKLVFIQPRSRSLSDLEEQCRFFFKEFSLRLEIDMLPSLSDSPYEEIFPSLDAVSSRMKFFSSLLRRSPSLLLTNFFGLLKPFPCPEDLKGSFLELEKGMKFNPDRLLQILEEYGYTREDLVATPGEFASRGGIIDLFSPWAKFPYRVEFGAEEVASLREFDPSSQRSSSRLPRILVPSLREFPASPSFLKEWERLALGRGADGGADLRIKIDALKKKEFFPSFVFLSLLHADHFVSFPAYLSDALFIIDDVEEVEREWRETRDDLQSQAARLQAEKKFLLPFEEIYPASSWEEIKTKAVSFEALRSLRVKKVHSFPFQSVPRFDNKIPFFLQYVKRLQKERDRCFIYLSNPTVRQKMAALLAQEKIASVEESSPFRSPRGGEVLLLLGGLERGFAFPKEKISFFSEKDIFTEERVIVSRPVRKSFVSYFQDLRENDYVVHTDYGIGIFRGLVKLEVDGQGREFLELAYQDEDRLYVPVESLNLLQKYARVGASLPPLDKLGGPQWPKTKERTRKAIEKMAVELLELYAQRKARKGFPFSPSGAWESEFQRSFEYEETEDQLTSIKEILRDMESDSPMDRLLCGDVGYGKTEVALRASFKAVMDGKQVAVLCPTTVLASQHLKTFRNRMILFPVRVEALTRLQSRSEQKKIVEDQNRGLVDIVIGTHRLLSKDVGFHDLGLLIVDEEQRFGVNHKEKIKQMKANIDVLTLTATPIPRTLNLSLSGLRDISLIETPPKDRLAIHTVVTPFSPKLIASAIKQELSRGGQVYYIHNKIEDIERVAAMVEKLVPQARVVFIHGKMAGLAIEKRMIDFISGLYDVLVSTTIIENGIDIPRVNTLIVDRADLYGLSQLYQLRGRVGRSARQAYAYFLVPPFLELTPQAKERLKALKEFSELGSGFRLAAKDLEIRGAGNLLGGKQHGYLEAVGFDYFMHLLDQTIKKLKGEEVEEVKCEINLRVEMRIPEDYLPQINLRLNLYKKISSIETLEEIERIKEDARDRFGSPPPALENLLRYGIIKYLAQKLKIKSLDKSGMRLVIKFYSHSPADLDRLSRLLKARLGTITPQGIVTLPLSGETDGVVLDETTSFLKQLYGYTIMT